jgi:hypothetical protein
MAIQMIMILMDTSAPSPGEVAQVSVVAACKVASALKAIADELLGCAVLTEFIVSAQPDVPVCPILVRVLGDSVRAVVASLSIAMRAHRIP